MAMWNARDVAYGGITTICSTQPISVPTSNPPPQNQRLPVRGPITPLPQAASSHRGVPKLVENCVQAGQGGPASKPPSATMLLQQPLSTVPLQSSSTPLQSSLAPG
jgi:hypothetical protein